MVRLTCLHKGTYADDCLMSRVQQHRCFIVGTCDKALKRRLRQLPGVPIMFINKHKYVDSDISERRRCSHCFRVFNVCAEW